MTILHKVISLFLVLPFLFGCKSKPYTYEYLMMHPEVLQREAPHCQIELIRTAQCEIIRKASNDFFTLVNDRQNNPEEFGDKILKMQIQLAGLKNGLLSKDKTSVEFQKSQTQVKNLQSQLNILLKVVSATSMQ